MAKKKQAERLPRPKALRCSDLVPEGYEAFVDEIKERIRSAQARAAIAVNQELVLLYWERGREVLARQRSTAGARRSSAVSPPTSRTPSLALRASPRGTFKYMRHREET